MSGDSQSSHPSQPVLLPLAHTTATNPWWFVHESEQSTENKLFHKLLWKDFPGTPAPSPGRCRAASQREPRRFPGPITDLTGPPIRNSPLTESCLFRTPPPARLRVLLGLMHRTPQATPEEMKGIIMETTEAVSETRSVAVTRVAPTQLEAVWRTLMTPAGAQILLGAGGQLGNKGEAWKADDGTYGITRSFHPKEQIRFSWHASEGAPTTRVDLRMRSVEGGTELTIVHDRLPEDADLEALRTRWETTLENLISAS